MPVQQGKTRPQHREIRAPLFAVSVWVLQRLLLTVAVKMQQETGPTVYRPYPSRLKRPTICKCHAKAACSPQLFLDPERWSGLGLERETSRAAVRRTTN